MIEIGSRTTVQSSSTAASPTMVTISPWFAISCTCDTTWSMRMCDGGTTSVPERRICTNASPFTRRNMLSDQSRIQAMSECIERYHADEFGPRSHRDALDRRDRDSDPREAPRTHANCPPIDVLGFHPARENAASTIGSRDSP